MSYRKAWRRTKAVFPEAHCIGMSGGFRIARNHVYPDCIKEFYSLGNGLMRKQAWEEAANTAEAIQKMWHLEASKESEA